MSIVIVDMVHKSDIDDSRMELCVIVFFQYKEYKYIYIYIYIYICKLVFKLKSI